VTVRGQAAVSAGSRAGEPAAGASFDAFFAATVTRTTAVVVALRGRDVAADEVVQDAYLRAFERWDEVATMERPDLWVQRVALNMATSQLRRLGAEARAVVRLRGRTPRSSAVDDPLPHERFWRLVRRLPDRQARVVALHYAADLSVVEVAEVLGIAEGTVKSHLHAARARLAVLLEDEEGRDG
jgi:RNA polymerase sigma-70 factor (ECF subfamily)